jgi:hypothetical protein
VRATVFRVSGGIDEPVTVDGSSSDVVWLVGGKGAVAPLAAAWGADSSWGSLALPPTTSSGAA